MLQADTLLVDALKQDEKLLERIGALDERLKKFSKILGDERVASALSLKDVARMLDFTLDAFVDFANGQAPTNLRGVSFEVPALSQADIGTITKTLDLRPQFEQKKEPLMIVLDTVSSLKPDDALMVEAPFHPMPMRRLLGGWGYRSYATQLSPEHWQVTFKR